MKDKENFKTVNWRTYLDDTNNERVKRFLRKRGIAVYTELVKSIDMALEYGTENLIVLIHPNVTNLIQIVPNEFPEVLNQALNFFKSREAYEMCSETVKIINKVQKNVKNK